jgi:hypothetical protein
MSRNAWIAASMAVVAGVGGFYWYAGTQKAGIPAHDVLAPPVTPEAGTPVATEEAKVAYPLPAEAPQAEHPLPPLAASDSQVLAALEALFGKQPLESMLIPDQLIRRFVVTVNSLDGEAVSLRQRPLRHTPGLLVVEQKDERLFLSPQNGKRYMPLVKVLESADPQRVVDLYVRYYPLLQKAYAELGYPDRYFNDRVVDVIDHLLETREVAGPIELVRPKVFYEFADRDLEKRSSGEKILIRIGAGNAEIVRRQLRALRDELVARSLKP